MEDIEAVCSPWFDCSFDLMRLDLEIKHCS